MTTVYKLTTQDMKTYGGFTWKLGATQTAPGGGELCTDRWLHAYTDPLVASLLNPAHANISDPRLFRAEGEVGADDHGLKVGCTSLTLVEELKVPQVTTEQRVRFAVLCALEVSRDEAWKKWAWGWLSGKDRSAEAAYAAAANAAANAAYAAAYAARAAAYAARAAVNAAYAAAYAAAHAADAAVHAARAAPIDLPKLARKAVAE